MSLIYTPKQLVRVCVVYLIYQFCDCEVMDVIVPDLNRISASQFAEEAQQAIFLVHINYIFFWLPII